MIRSRYFPFRIHESYYLNGQKYYVRESGLRLLRLFQREIDLQKNNRSLLRLRSEIRQAIASAPPSMLSYLLKHRRRERTVRLVLLILGKSRQHMSVRYIFSLHDHESAKVRLAVVRALHRLHAWDKLRRLEKITDDDVVRRLAEQSAKPNFDARLSGFLGNVTTFASSNGGDRELYIAQDVSVDESAPPKSSWAIRRFLRRIRAMVRLSINRRNRRLLQLKSAK